MENRLKSLFSIATPVVVILVSLVVFALSSGVWGVKPGMIPHDQQVEERFGIEFTAIQLTAGSGMIDVRYRVLDVGKAKNFGHFTETTPMIIEQNSGKIIDVAIMGFHNHRVELGRSYYLLYRNTGSAIQPGSKITLKIDTIEIKDIVIR